MTLPQHYPKTRLFVEAALIPATPLELKDSQAHYLNNVLRLRVGDTIAVFNGRDGEWEARIIAQGKKNCQVEVIAQLRPQRKGSDIWLAFAPIKHARIDYLVEKATELGAAKLIPVITQYTMVSRVNTDRLRAHAIEAAEQSERLEVPEVSEPIRFSDYIANWSAQRHLLFCDESGEGKALKTVLASLTSKQWAILIGPEGGFSSQERAQLRALSCVTAISLGPRILRADTAALAALSCLQAWAGDWQENSSFLISEEKESILHG